MEPRTIIKGRLTEQKNHSGKQPPLLGTITVGRKQYDIAGWIYYEADGFISISLEDTVIKKTQ